MSASFDRPHSTWEVELQAGESLHLSGFIEALKELDDNIRFVSVRTYGNRSSDVRVSFYDLWRYVQRPSLRMSVVEALIGSRLEVAREALDTFRAELGIAVHTWEHHGGVRGYSAGLLEELREVIGLVSGEEAMATSPGTVEGCVVKEWIEGNPTYRWGSASEANGSPSRTASWCSKRIVCLPAATRCPGVESWLVWRHGGGGGWTGQQTLRVRRGDFSAADPEATYNSPGVVYLEDIATLLTIPAYARVDRLTGYPADEREDAVYLFIEMEDDEGPVDQGNVYPVITGADPDDPEIYLWQPGV